MKMKKIKKTFIEKVMESKPEINVVEKETMDDRISIVFKQIAETLKKSLGPLGAHAIISQSPNYHVTKDGFTIMKNINYASKYGYIDQVISGMIADICGRLNFAVGDGTTSAVLSANAMYQEFNTNKEEIQKLFFLPRNVLSRMKEITEDVIRRLENEHAIDIKSLPMDEMCDYIRRVVYISSNADVEMTDTIVNLYKEIGYPAISVVKAADGITKGKTIEGFMFHAKLMDRLYVNNDNNTQDGTNYDVVIFDHKVGLKVYSCFLRPLSFLCNLRGRKLICIAPMYDEVALHGDILNDLNEEYRRNHDINLVLMGFRASRAYDKKRIQDLAMLCNTSVITQAIENEIVKRAEVITPPTANDYFQFINLDNRGVSGIKVAKDMSSKNPMTTEYIEYSDSTKDSIKDLFEYKEGEFYFRVGFCGKASLSMDKESIFSNFHYDENLYNKYVEDAKREFELAIEKYKRLGTFNFEIDDTQKRYLSLKLKMGQIEVGAKTDFSQEFLVDAMDDAIKAAESAYRNGVVLGCHTDLLIAIKNEMENESLHERDKYLLHTLFSAFRKVRFTVLGNGFSNKNIDDIFGFFENIIGEADDENSYERGIDILLTEISNLLGIKVVIKDELKDTLQGFFSYEYDYLKENKIESYSLFDVINDMELYGHIILNLDIDTSKEDPTIYFDRNVINSTATDREILIASSDLVSLLTTGNQLVIARGNRD